MDLVPIEAVVLPDHAASSRVLEKAGMAFEGLLYAATRSGAAGRAI